ncbi:MAG: DUF333 domain-containing protein [Anaerolineales bacterium]|nr:DUF333 domain-containing protein [Anaerolineales bacterium]
MFTLNSKLFNLLVAVFIVWGITACSSGASVPTPTPSAIPEPEISSSVIDARDAVLDFMREGAIISVPNKSAPWHANLGPTTEGFEVYQFSGNNVLLSVSYPLKETTDMVYHVTLTNLDIGLCWQANTDSKGHIIATGIEASMFPELITAAADFCQAQGYQYDKNPKAEENQCGICTFKDNSTCNAWAYYQGFCQPGDHPATD